MMKTGTELANACMNAAKNHKTLYVMGCWGAPMTDANKQRWQREQEYNRREDRAAKLNAATADTFGFDCVGLIKGLLWGWNGSPDKSYGGAGYAINGVPDINEERMMGACTEVSTDFSGIAVGEVVWMPGHIGVYVGGDLAVECTPIWEDGVQITACNRDVAGYHRRNWTKHGKLPYLTYSDKPASEHYYRVRKTWANADSQSGAYQNLEYAKAACPEGYSVFDWNGKAVYTNAGKKEAFIRAVQAAIGAAVDGKAGEETLSKTVTVGANFGSAHAVVKPLQERLWELGCTEVGQADGIAGPKFASALAHFQRDHGCAPTGIAEEWGKTWQKLLGMA